MDNTLQFVYKLFFLISLAIYTNAQFNPTILQDTRNEPKVDGTFGFLYRTEDGISHAAKGEPGGHVVGRFTYTDPTGLKVNYNYNAGSGVTPKYNYNAAPVASAPVYNNQGVQEDRRTRPQALDQQPQYQDPQPVQQQQQQYYQPQPVQPQPIQRQPIQYQPVQQPIQQPIQYQPVQQPVQNYQPVYQQPIQPLQPQGLQHPLSNLQPDPNLPEDDGTYHPELDAHYDYHDSDNTVNNVNNNNYPVPVYGKK